MINKKIRQSLIAMIFVCWIIVFSEIITKAAPLSNVPVTLAQPNGDVIKCLASGDEFFNYYHDYQGQLIIKNPRNGYYTYAKYVQGEVKSSQHSVDPDYAKEIGVKNSRDITTITINDINLPIDQINEAKKKMVPVEVNNQVQNSVSNSKKINNIVIFVRFSDQGNFTDGLSTYKKYFDDTNSGSTSVRNYYKTVSYNKLDIETQFYPKANGDNILTYTDSHPRSYYAAPGNRKTEREHTLLLNAVNYVKDKIPSNIDLDYNNDGNVDNVAFIVEGETEGWSSLLWPHRWTLFSKDVEINGKKVNDYNFLLESYTNPAVICHEMFHTLGGPDLYHYGGKGVDAVGEWDLMCKTTTPPQQMGIYMKHKYGKFVDNIPQINKSGSYTLKSVASPTNNGYMIKLPQKNNEFFVLEFRNKSDKADSTIPSTGLLVYRINPNINGNEGGPPDEVYILRPNRTVSNPGEPYDASLNDSLGRTSIGGANNSIYYSDGSSSELLIENVRVLGDTVNFDVKFPNDVKIPSFQKDIESVNDGDVLSGTKEIKGYYLYNNPISKVEVLVDNNIVGNSTRGGRDDLKDRFKDYKVDNANYSYMLDTTKFETGNHKLTVRATGSDGRIDEISKQFKIINKILPYKGMIVSIENGTVLQGTKEISGCYMYGKSINKVEVLVDSNSVGTAELSFEPNIDRDYKGYSLDKAHFKYNLDLSGLSEGNHRITVRATGIDGSTDTLPEITVVVLRDITEFDYLSNINWKSATTGWETLQKDKSVEKNPITLKGKKYDKGIGTHSNSDIVYALNGKYNRFTAVVGVDGEVKREGTVIFRVYGDGRLLFQSDILSGDDKTAQVNVSTKGINELKLSVIDAGNGNSWDHADWADAKLYTSRSTEKTAQQMAGSIDYNVVIWDNQNMVVLPQVPKEYGIRIASSNLEKIIDLSGNIHHIGRNIQVALTFEVIRKSDNTKARTKIFNIVVPGVVPIVPVVPVVITTESTNNYLSDMDWKSATIGWKTVQKDKSVEKNPITLKGKKYDKGIGTHSNSDIVYALNGKYNRFTAIVGVDGEVKREGTVIFRVYGDGRLLFQSAILSGDDKTAQVDVSIKGINQLKLSVIDAGNGNSCDHADWADAKLYTSDANKILTMESEPNNSLDKANGPIFSDVNISGSFDAKDTSDYYYFDVTNPGKIDISVINNETARINWVLYNDFDTSKYVAYATRTGKELKGSYNVPKAGKYYLLIYKTIQNANDAYTINIKGAINKQ